MKVLPWRMAILLALCCAAVVLGGRMMLGGGTVPWFEVAPTLQQPIAFSHRKHTAGANGIKCERCHTYSSATTGTFAGLPQVATCMYCHQMVERMSAAKLAKKPDLAKFKQFVPAGYIPWQQVYSVPDYVYFPHRRHVAVAKLACADCHGDVRNMAGPVVRPVVNQSMGWCINCHQQKRASQDCISCHK